MEKEINIAEILKDKPQGTKLYDLLYNVDVELDTISTTDTETVVWCKNETDNNTTCHLGYSEFGTVRGCPNGLQILLPSKEMRDWSNFDWKKGDVLVCYEGNKPYYTIFDCFESNTYKDFKGKFSYDSYEDKWYQNECNISTNTFHKLSLADSEIYIKKIEERFGGKLNLETLEIEKQPEFKDGDIVVLDGDSKSHYKTILLYQTNIDDEYEVYSFLNTGTSYLGLEATLMDDRKARLATDSEKQQLFDALAKEGKRWNPNTKQIEDLPKKCEFKPMDWCLMKDSTKYWELCQFAYTKKVHGTTIYSAVGGLVYYKCIPYNEETAHLLGTTDEWKRGEG